MIAVWKPQTIDRTVQNPEGQIAVTGRNPIARWRVLDQTVEEARARFSDMPKKKLQSLIAEATQSLRTLRVPKIRKARQSNTV